MAVLKTIGEIDGCDGKERIKKEKEDKGRGSGHMRKRGNEGKGDP